MSKPLVPPVAGQTFLHEGKWGCRLYVPAEGDGFDTELLTLHGQSSEIAAKANAMTALALRLPELITWR